MVEVAPDLRAADIALTEVINEKLTFESTDDQKEPEANVVKFPGAVVGKKRAA